jgi:hypothetical protein
LFLVLGVAKNRACAGTDCTTDGGTFKGSAGLVTEDATCCGTNETTCDGTALGVRTGWSGAVAEGDAGNSGDGEEC